MWFEITTTILLLLIGAGIAVINYRTRKIHKRVWDLEDIAVPQILQAPDSIYPQVQALLKLDRQLGIVDQLPPLRGWAASPDFLSIVADHILQTRPDVIVECGSGASTIVLAKCVALNGKGHIYSLDHEAEFADKTSALLQRSGLEDYAEVITAPISQLKNGNEVWPWYTLTKFPDLEIDVLIVDGPPMPLGKMVRYPAGPKLIPNLRPGGSVILDDAARSDEQEIITRWMEEFGPFERTDFSAEKGCVILTRRE